MSINGALRIAAAMAGSSSSVTDPNWSSVSLLLHCDGTNASTTFTDSSSNAHTVTAAGNAQVSTTTPKYGTGKLLLDGTGDYSSVPNHTSLIMGAGDFTIEMWVQSNAATAGYLYCKGVVSTMFGIYKNTNNTIAYITASGSSKTVTTTALVDGTWAHVAVVRSSGTTSIYIDGTQSGTPFTDGGDYTTTGVLYIGSYGNGTQNVNANIDDLRVTKGVARYTANFTPPTAAFPNS